MIEGPVRICGNCVYWGDETDYCPYTMNLYPAFEPGCVNHRTTLEFSADYKRMVGEEVMNAEKRLKPCPFCGADIESGVHIDVVVSFDELEDDTHYGVICENCGARIGYFKILEEAVEAWNRNKSRELFREKSRKADKT